jgi:hypothetical protein
MSWLKEDVAAPDNFRPLCCSECPSAKQGCQTTMMLPSARTCDGVCGLGEGTETYAPADVDATNPTGWVRRMQHREQQKQKECNRTLWFILLALVLISLISMCAMTKKN